MLPPALVSTLQCTLPSQLGPMSAGIFTVVKASVLILVLMSAIVMYSGWAPSHSWQCWSITPAMLTSSSWGLWVCSNIYHICFSVSTLPVVGVAATLLLLSAFWFPGGLWATTAPTV